MGLFDFSKKKKVEAAVAVGMHKAYAEPSTNHLYNLLFCDDPDLYQGNMKPPFSSPFDILFSAQPDAQALEAIANDPLADPRVRILACRRLYATGHPVPAKELLGIVVEVGMDEGLDTLASFVNGTARYINFTGKTILFETTEDAQANAITSDLFEKSREIVNRIGPWDKPRKAPPPRGYTRISFLVSDGLYFGEAPTNALFSDALAAPALAAATRLMQYLTEQKP